MDSAPRRSTRARAAAKSADPPTTTTKRSRAAANSDEPALKRARLATASSAAKVVTRGTTASGGAAGKTKALAKRKSPADEDAEGDELAPAPKMVAVEVQATTSRGRGRPKKVPVVGASASGPAQEEAQAPAAGPRPRGRPRKNVETEPAEPVKKRGRPALEKSGALAKPATKKVTFEVPEERAERDSEAIEPPTKTAVAANKKTPGLSGKPVRKAAATKKSAAAATRAIAMADNKSMPLSPKKANQLIVKASAESDDELGMDEKPVLRGGLKKLPVKAALKTKTVVPPASKNDENDENAIHRASPTAADVKHMLATPAKRLPASPTKGSIVSPAKRVEGVRLFQSSTNGTQNENDNTTKLAPKMSLLQSPAKKPAAPIALKPEIDNAIAEPAPKMSLLQSPAKKPRVALPAMAEEAALTKSTQSPLKKSFLTTPAKRPAVTPIKPKSIVTYDEEPEAESPEHNDTSPATPTPAEKKTQEPVTIQTQPETENAEVSEPEQKISENITDKAEINEEETEEIAIITETTDEKVDDITMIAQEATIIVEQTELTATRNADTTETTTDSTQEIAQEATEIIEQSEPATQHADDIDIIIDSTHETAQEVIDLVEQAETAATQDADIIDSTQNITHEAEDIVEQPEHADTITNSTQETAQEATDIFGQSEPAASQDADTITDSTQETAEEARDIVASNNNEVPVRVTRDGIKITLVDGPLTISFPHGETLERLFERRAAQDEATQHPSDEQAAQPAIETLSETITQDSAIENTSDEQAAQPAVEKLSEQQPAQDLTTENLSQQPTIQDVAAPATTENTEEEMPISFEFKDIPGLYDNSSEDDDWELLPDNAPSIHPPVDRGEEIPRRRLPESEKIRIKVVNSALKLASPPPKPANTENTAADPVAEAMSAEPPSEEQTITPPAAIEEPNIQAPAPTEQSGIENTVEEQTIEPPAATEEPTVESPAPTERLSIENMTADPATEQLSTESPSEEQTVEPPATEQPTIEAPAPTEQLSIENTAEEEQAIQVTAVSEQPTIDAPMPPENETVSPSGDVEMVAASEQVDQVGAAEPATDADGDAIMAPGAYELATPAVDFAAVEVFEDAATAAEEAALNNDETPMAADEDAATVIMDETLGTSSCDTSTSEGSEVYDDENKIPIDPALLALSSKPTTPRRPLRPRREVHTAVKVPLKPADDEATPRPLTTGRYPTTGLRRSERLRNAAMQSPSRGASAAMEAAEEESAAAALWSAVGTPGRTPRRDLNPALLKGAVVYVDVHTSEGADASSIFVELLAQMGARCVKGWSWNPAHHSAEGTSPAGQRFGITHVVYKDGGVRTMEKVRATNGMVKCVGVSWVLDCERENKWLDETPYLIDTSIVPRGGARRRKSMEPRALANNNGTLTYSSPGSTSNSGSDYSRGPKTPTNQRSRRESSLWEWSPGQQPSEEDTAEDMSYISPYPPLSTIRRPTHSYRSYAPEEYHESSNDRRWAALTPVPQTPATRAVQRFVESITPGSPSESGSPIRPKNRHQYFAYQLYDDNDDSIMTDDSYGHHDEHSNEHETGMKTCPPPKRSVFLEPTMDHRLRLFPHGSSYSNGNKNGQNAMANPGLEARLTELRRKSLPFAPKIGSPLSKVWKPGK